MVDQVEIHRVTEGGPDPLTGQDRSTRELVYAGKAKVQSFEGYEHSGEVSGRVTVLQRMSLHIPVGEYRPQVGHVAKILSSPDGNLVGTEYRMVQDAPFKTHATAYRVFVEFAAT